jgi:hypothetical protein
VNGSFDVEAHLRGRYVVYSAEFRTELVGRSVEKTESIGGGSDPRRLAAAAREAGQALARYLAMRTDEVERGGVVHDAETRRQLEALGYLEPAEEEAREGVRPAAP